MIAMAGSAIRPKHVAQFLTCTWAGPMCEECRSGRGQPEMQTTRHPNTCVDRLSDGVADRGRSARYTKECTTYVVLDNSESDWVGHCRVYAVLPHIIQVIRTLAAAGWAHYPVPTIELIQMAQHQPRERLEKLHTVISS